MDDAVLNSKLTALEQNARIASQLADHAIKRAGVLEAAVVQLATTGKLDFDALRAAVMADFSATPETEKKLDAIIAELRQRMP